MKKLPNGPIPGENFVANTKNLPWHRPPELSDPNKAIEAIVKQIMKPAKATGLLNMISMGLPITVATDVLLTSGVAQGKWTIDMAIFLAGPTARIIELMCKGYGIEYEMGFDEEEIPPGKEFFEQSKDINKQEVLDTIETIAPEIDKIKDSVENTDENVGGFMPQPRGE